MFKSKIRWLIRKPIASYQVRQWKMDSSKKQKLEDPQKTLGKKNENSNNNKQSHRVHRNPKCPETPPPSSFSSPKSRDPWQAIVPQRLAPGRSGGPKNRKGGVCLLGSRRSFSSSIKSVGIQRVFSSFFQKHLVWWVQKHSNNLIFLFDLHEGRSGLLVTKIP